MTVTDLDTWLDSEAADRPPCEAVEVSCTNETVCQAVYDPYCCTGPRQALCAGHRDELFRREIRGGGKFRCPCGTSIRLIKVVPLCP